MKLERTQNLSESDAQVNSILNGLNDHFLRCVCSGLEWTKVRFAHQEAV
jgi:hypothetical protein